MRGTRPDAKAPGAREYCSCFQRYGTSGDEVLTIRRWIIRCKELSMESRQSDYHMGFSTAPALSSSQDADEGTREDSSFKSPRYNASSKQKNTSIHLADDLEVYIGMHTRVKRGSSWHYKDFRMAAQAIWAIVLDLVERVWCGYGGCRTTGGKYISRRPRS